MVTAVSGSAAFGDGGTNGVPGYRRIVFPVQEHVSYSDTFNACRDGCSRRHEGEDLIGQRLLHELAAVDGTVGYMATDAHGTGGNWLEIRDSAGWRYNYGHINNDTPGTDDGANPAQWRFAPGIVVGAHVKAGQFVAYMGDSGNAEDSVPHLHFEIRRPDYTAIDEYPSLRLAQGLDAGGGQCRFPSMPEQHPTSASGAGYWAATATGAIYAFGGAKFYGGLGGTALNRPVTGVTPRTTGHGSWLYASDGGVVSFGDAPFYGSTGAMHLNQPIVSMAATPSGHGYWLLASDGGVFSFGDADFYGSMASLGFCAPLPVVSIAASQTGHGYWLLQSDGHVRAFGDAEPYGDASAAHVSTVAFAVMP